MTVHEYDDYIHGKYSTLPIVRAVKRGGKIKKIRKSKQSRKRKNFRNTRKTRKTRNTRNTRKNKSRHNYIL